MSSTADTSTVVATRTDGLTPKQARVLEVIIEYIAEHGFPPSYREIADAMGWRSTNCTCDYLQALERKGRIVLMHGKRSRAIRVVGLDVEPIDLSELQRERDEERARAQLWESRARELGWSDGTFTSEVA